jgi:hypothetical protein
LHINWKKLALLYELGTESEVKLTFDDIMHWNEALDHKDQTWNEIVYLYKLGRPIFIGYNEYISIRPDMLLGDILKYIIKVTSNLKDTNNIEFKIYVYSPFNIASHSYFLRYNLDNGKIHLFFDRYWNLYDNDIPIGENKLYQLIAGIEIQN